MAHESSVRVGSGVSVLRAGLVPGFPGTLPGMRGTNAVVINYEDINSLIGIIQSSSVSVTGAVTGVHITTPANRLRGRRQVTIQNLGPQTAYIGEEFFDIDDGYPIGSGVSLTLDILDRGDIFTHSDGVSDLRILELK